MLKAIFMASILLILSVFEIAHAARPVLEPPPVPNICMKEPPPGIASLPKGFNKVDNCANLEYMVNRYVQKEGENNKGLVFLDAFDLFLRINKTDSQFNDLKISDFEKYFGKADFKNKSIKNGIEETHYSYHFSYKAKKDWAYIVSFSNNGFMSSGLSETKRMVFKGWEILK